MARIVFNSGIQASTWDSNGLELTYTVARMHFALCLSWLSSTDCQTPTLGSLGRFMPVPRSAPSWNGSCQHGLRYVLFCAIAFILWAKRTRPRILNLLQPSNAFPKEKWCPLCQSQKASEFPSFSATAPQRWAQLSPCRWLRPR